MRRHLELTHRGHLCLALLHLTAGAAWLTGDDNARLAASMLAAPLVLDVLHKLVRAPRIALSVALRRVHARSSFLESVEVRNVSATQPVRDLTLGEPRTQLYESGGAFIPWLEPGASVTVRIAARSARRGCFTSRTFVAETWHPFGLLRWRATFDLRACLIAEPARAPLPDDVVREISAARPEPSSGRRAEDSEFFHLREYRPGDDARHVHGRRSAALGMLVTGVFRGNQEPRCTVVVDLRRPPGMPPGFHGPQLEVQLSRAATLVDLLSARGSRFRCIVIDGDVSVFESDTRDAAAPFLEVLADARSVPYRHVESELLDLDPAATCFWIAAGGYRDPGCERSTGPPNRAMIVVPA